MNLRLASIVVAVALAAAAGGYFLGRGSMGGAGTSAAPHAEPRRILYYRNPMGLEDTSPVPKKDSMGMDYIPVHEGEEHDASGTVTLTPEKLQTLGVRTARVTRQRLDVALRAAGSVEIAEPRLHLVAPRFGGWIDRLHVAVTGSRVQPGSPLLEIYSPELISAQREYLIALEGAAALDAGAAQSAGASVGAAGMDRLAQAALARLRSLGVPPAAIERLRRERQVARTFTYTAPAGGTVIEKTAVQGMRFEAGEVLYRIADLSRVWVMAEIPEQDLAWLRTGQPVRFETAALPGRSFAGVVGFIEPTLSPTTRTARARIELDNEAGELKPAMFGRVAIDVGALDEPRLTVPRDAVIDSGTRQIALVQLAPGRFRPRELRIGRRGEERLEILGGLREGETVVSGANFLIDAESSLRAALGGMDAAAHAH